MHLPQPTQSVELHSSPNSSLTLQPDTKQIEASDYSRRSAAIAATASNQTRAMEKCRSVPHEHSSAYYGGYDYEDVSGGAGKSYSFNGPSARDDPEAKRRRRVAAYNVFATQARLKSNVRSSVKWLKSKFSDVRYGGI